MEIKRAPVRFFRLPSGAEPVRDRLRALPKAERPAIGQDLKRAEFRWPIGMPLCLATKRRRLTRIAVARRARMTPTAFDRLLAPNDVGVSLRSPHRAAEALGKKIRIELADA